MVQLAGVVVKAEQERADHRPGPVLVPAEACDHAVRGALVLHLQHRPLVRLIGLLGALGHDSVQAGAFEAREPVLRERPIARRRRQVQGRVHPPEGGLEPRPPLGLGRLAQVLSA